MGFPSDSDGKVSACNAGDPGLIPGLGRSLGEGKIPWRREWLLPTTVFLPEKHKGQRRLAGNSPWGCKESDTTEQLTRSLSSSRFSSANRQDCGFPSPWWGYTAPHSTHYKSPTTGWAATPQDGVSHTHTKLGRSTLSTVSWPTGQAGPSFSLPSFSYQFPT